MDKLKIEYVDINTIKPYKNNANTYSVYMHLFPNNKVYIGITKFKPEYRWNNGDEEIDGKPYSEIVEIARDYINKQGGFEKFAEWGLY